MQKRLYNHNIITKADKGDAVVIVDVDRRYRFRWPSLLLTLVIVFKKPINN